MQKSHQQETGSAFVANLATYRASRFEAASRAADCTEIPEARSSNVRTALSDALERLTSPAIAYAAVLLSEDGTITLSAAGVEPEFTPALESALAQLQGTVRSHGKRHRKRPKGHSGFSSLLPLLSTAFLAATYVNDIALLDVALCLAAQLTAGLAVRIALSPG